MTAIALGTYKKDEVPLDVTYTFADSTNVAIDLTGYTAKVNTTSPAGVSADYNATITTAASGIVTVAWSAAMTGEVGPWYMDIWVNNGSKSLVSARLVYNVTYSDAPSFA